MSMIQNTRQAVILDKLDQKILRLLQENGRLTNLEVAQRVNLSASPCLRRIRRLEKIGVIRQYTTLLEPEKLGLGLLVFVNVRLEKRRNAQRGKAPAESFSIAAQSWPEVVACYSLSGEFDYLLKVRVVDMAHFVQLLNEHLLMHPDVIDIKSHFVLTTTKETTALPLPELTEVERKNIF